MSEELELLIESTTIAFRERGLDGRAKPSPAWTDLPPDAREAAFDLQARTRDLERAVDAASFSGTVRAVMMRLTGG
jgi:hypothetical protein